MSSNVIVEWKCDRDNRMWRGPVEQQPTGWTQVKRTPLGNEVFGDLSTVSTTDLCDGCSRQLQSFLINKDDVPPAVA